MAQAPQTLQRVSARIAKRAMDDLAELWYLTSPSELGDAVEFLQETLPVVATKYGTSVGALSAQWYDDMRNAQGIRGDFVALVPEVVISDEQTDIMARWAAGTMLGAEPDPAATLAKAQGSLQRLVMNMQRETVMQAVENDPSSPRYARHASANACKFCRMLASRGAVYLSAERAGMVVGRTGSDGGKDRAKAKALGRVPGARQQGGSLLGAKKRRVGGRDLGSKYHDHCHCIAVPEWDVDQSLVDEHLANYLGYKDAREMGIEHGHDAGPAPARLADQLVNA